MKYNTNIGFVDIMKKLTIAKELKDVDIDESSSASSTPDEETEEFEDLAPDLWDIVDTEEADPLGAGSGEDYSEYQDE